MIEKTGQRTEDLIQKVVNLERALQEGGLKMDDIYSLNLLQSLINGYPFLPLTGSSLRPYCLAHIINDITINGRKDIIEFGSGISTILIGRLIKKNHLSAKLLSIEHNDSWVVVLKRLLVNEQLDEVVTVLHAPLVKCSLSADGDEWYDLEVLKGQIKTQKYDAVIIDGPPAWESGKKKARYPALPFMVDKLADNFSIYLDDANRAGEQYIIRQWEKDHGIRFNITGGTLAFCYGGTSFYTEPITYC